MEDRTWTALKLAGVVAGLGILVSRFVVIQWLGQQGAVVLFILWWLVLYVFVNVLAYAVQEDWEPSYARVSLGILMIAFAIGIVLYWPTSTYAVLASGGDPSQVPSFVLATEDEVTYQAWWVLGVRDLTALGILTYGLTPFLLIFAGVSLISPEAVGDALSRLFERA